MQNTPTFPPWVDWLFARLAVRYGDSWFRKWEGLPMADVKRDWQRQLWRTAENNPAALRHALEHLPEFPPTCDVILRLCLQHTPKYAALAAPKTKPNAEFAAQVLQRIKGATASNSLSGAERCAQRLEAKVAAGEVLTVAQRAQLAAIRGTDTATDASFAQQAEDLQRLKDEAAAQVAAYVARHGIALGAVA